MIAVWFAIEHWSERVLAWSAVGTGIAFAIAAVSALVGASAAALHIASSAFLSK